MQQNYEVQDPYQPQQVAPQQRPIKIKRGRNHWRQYAETIAIALLAALILRVFVISAYKVSSGSMEDTLAEGDYIFVNKLAYAFSDPTPGDIVVFENPYDDNKDYIKRIVAVGGQTVEMYDKILFVDGEVAPIPRMSKNIDNRILPNVLSNRDNCGPMMVPEGQYFVMGDNRDDSQDSRFWGCVDKKFVKGKAAFVYFSYEPDANAPQWQAPYIVEFFEIAFYNLFHFPSRLRPGRIGSIE